MYETELLEQLSDSEAAKEFFTFLDLQLNKVNKFYKSKEKEFLDRGETLKRQIEILIELKEHRGGKDVNFAQDHGDDSSISCTLSCGSRYSIPSLSRYHENMQILMQYFQL